MLYIKDISHFKLTANNARALHVKKCQKRVKARLRELAPAARGSQDAGSRNLAFAFFDTSVVALCSRTSN